MDAHVPSFKSYLQNLPSGLRYFLRALGLFLAIAFPFVMLFGSLLAKVQH